LSSPSFYLQDWPQKKVTAMSLSSSLKHHLHKRK
jgi:hypothetical protein